MRKAFFVSAVMCIMCLLVAAQAGAVERVSVDSSGNQANGESWVPSISADGRYVAFASTAALVPEDTNGTFDIYVHDRETGVTEWVSGNIWESVAGIFIFGPTISADGRYVAFATNGVRVYVHDRETGVKEYVCDGKSAVISANGRFLAVGAITGGGQHNIYVHDRETGVQEWVSVDNDGNLQGAGGTFSISGDGRFVALYTSAIIYVPGAPSGTYVTLVRDRESGVMEVVSVDSDGNQLYSVWHPSISADGRYVAFNSLMGIFVRDRETA